MDNIQETAKVYTQQATDFIKKRSGTQIGIFVGLFVFLLIVIYFIYSFKGEQDKLNKFANQPVFMTEIEENLPHNTKNIYNYLDPDTGNKIPYIPGNLIREKNGTQYTFSFWILVNDNYGIRNTKSYAL